MSDLDEARRGSGGTIVGGKAWTIGGAYGSLSTLLAFLCPVILTRRSGEHGNSGSILSSTSFTASALSAACGIGKIRTVKGMISSRKRRAHLTVLN